MYFGFFFCPYVSRESRRMKAFQSPDILVSCLPFSLCLLVLLGIATSRTLVVLGAWLLQTSKLFENKRNR
jgi:hypothetical protein